MVASASVTGGFTFRAACAAATPAALTSPGTNFSPLLFTSGARMVMPSRRHSFTKMLILSVFATSLLITAAMNSTG